MSLERDIGVLTLSTLSYWLEEIYRATIICHFVVGGLTHGIVWTHVYTTTEAADWTVVIAHSSQLPEPCGTIAL